MREEKTKKERKREEKKVEDIRKIEGDSLRKVTVKIGPERIGIQEGIIVEVLLDSAATGLMMNSEFARRQGFKSKKMERPIYIRNMDRTFNNERLIENTVEVNIFYKRHRERIEIDVIRRQKWNIILEMP